MIPEVDYIPENSEIPVEVLWLNSNKICKRYNIESNIGTSLTLSLLIMFNDYYVLHPQFHVIGIFFKIAQEIKVLLKPTNRFCVEAIATWD